MEASLSSHYQYHRMQADRERCYSDNHHVSQFEAAAAAAAASAAATASLFDQHLSAMANSSAVVDDGLYRTFPIVFDRLPYMEIARAMAATACGVTYDAHAKAPAFGLHPTEDRHSKKNDQVAVASTSLPMPTGSRKYQRRSSVCASAVPASEHSGNSGNRERNCYEPKHQLTVDDVLASIRSGLAFTQDHLDAVLYGRRSGTYDQQELGRNGCQESTATSSMNLFEQHATISPSSPSVTKRTGSLSYGIDRLLQRNESNPSSQPQPPMTSSLTSRRLHRASLKTSPSTADLPEGLEIRRVWRGGNVHYGVYSIRSSIPRGTRFGPYRGRIVNPSEIKANDDNTFMWEVFVNGSLSHFVDGRGPAGSWMSYVNCARYPHEQNLVAVQTSKRVKTHSSITKSPPAHKYFSSTQLSPVFSKRKACEKICHDIESSDTAETSVSQFEGMGFDSAHGAEIYYETCQDIPFGAELLVWYGDCYEQFLGVPVALRSDGGNMPPVVNAAKSSSIQPTPSSPRLSPMLKAAEYPTQLALSPPHQKVSSSSEDAVNVAGGRSVRGDRSESTRHATDDASDGYQCSRCGKVFAYKYYRDKHLKYTRCVDQGDRKFPCHLCSRSFEKRDRLRIHVLHVHEKHRPHKCMLCSKSFSQSSSLNKHMRVHSGERPYKCVYCSKAFTASSILRTHIRQHSGEKPFKCKFCGKAFASHAAHDSHARRTHGTPPFAGASGDSTACGRCGRTFENSRELKIHDCTSPAPAAAADTIGFLGRFNKNSMKILDAYGSSSSFQRDSLQVSNEDEQIDVVGLEMNDDVIRA